MPHKWAQWLNNPCYVTGWQCSRAGETINGGPQMGQLAITPTDLKGRKASKRRRA